MFKEHLYGCFFEWKYVSRILDHSHKLSNILAMTKHYKSDKEIFKIILKVFSLYFDFS